MAGEVTRRGVCLGCESPSPKSVVVAVPSLALRGSGVVLEIAGEIVEPRGGWTEQLTVGDDVGAKTEGVEFFLSVD